MNHTIETTTFKLTQETIALITQELDALEKKPINGWDLTYKMLFTFLNTTVNELCIQAHIQTPPGLIIQFQKPATWQAAAYIMTDKSTQLHIGATSIRNVLSAPEADTAIRYQEFKWIIAHELGHLVDPLFKTYATTYQLRLILKKAITLIGYSGGIGMIWPRWAAFINISPYVLIGGSVTACFALYVFTILIHRKFEYQADLIAKTIYPDCSLKNIEKALHSMHDPIKQFCLTYTPATPKTALEIWFPSVGSFTLYKKYLCWHFFKLHPQIRQRIKALS